MTLPELEALGCYMSAGFIDHYDGAHTRLGEVTAGGDVVLYPAGEALLRTLAPVAEKPKARKGKKAESEAPAAESEAPAAESEAPAAESEAPADSDDSQGALADLDALLAG
jgi:hypothetical protein